MSDFPGLTDIHAHPAMNAFLWGRDLRRHYFTGKTANPLASRTDFKMLREGGVKVLWSALHVPEHQLFDQCWFLRLARRFTRGGRMLRDRTAWHCLLAQLGGMEAQVARTDDFVIVRSNVELDAARAAGHIAVLHTVEGGHVLGGDLARLDALADRGVASLILAHLFPNDLAGHAEAIPEQERSVPTCEMDTGVDLDTGLLPFGERVVDRMVELRMIPDVSHCTPKARAHIYARVANRSPLIASHVGVQSLNRVPYNLDETDVRAIKASGGVVGVIFMPYWLKTSHPGPGLDAIWETLRQLHAWSGDSWEHVAIGTDFDGFTDPADDCDSEGKLGLVRVRLEREGLGRADVEAVLGGNARRVLRDGWR